MNQVNVRVVAAVLSVSALCVAGCAGNQVGNVEATALGDTSHPAERGSPTQPLEEACGAQGALTADATPRIKRAPYLQQLTSSSVIVGWLSKTGESERIDVTRPDGTVVMTAEGKDDTSVRQTGEKQMWSTVTGLEPDTIYCYTLAAGPSALSERIGFRTAPGPNSTRPIRFLAFGDSGGGGGDQFALLEQMNKVPFDLMIHTGDIAYDSGTIDRVRGQRVLGLQRSVPPRPVLSGGRQPRLQDEAGRAVPRRVQPARATAARSGTRTTGAAFTSSRSTPRRTTRRR